MSLSPRSPPPPPSPSSASSSSPPSPCHSLSQSWKDSPFFSKRSLGFSRGSLTAFDERALNETRTFIRDEEDLEASDACKPFSGFGSFRQRHGESLECEQLAPHAVKTGGGTRFSAEAPAKLCSPGYGYEERLLQKKPSLSCELGEGSSHSAPDSKRLIKLKKQDSFSSDVDREEAWERKRDLHLMDMEIGHSSGPRVLRSVSDCGERVRSEKLEAESLPMRHRSLTDEDLEELRGCIDLGFGFSYDESYDLKGMLPALELYCAINKQYEDIKSRSSPVSPLDGPSLLRTSSGDSPNSSPSDSWRVSSPGDHPNQVKTRLRHWAQAVACSLKQGLSL